MARMLDSLSPNATIFTSRGAAFSASNAAAFRSCQLSSRLRDDWSCFSVSASTSSATRSPNSARMSSTVKSVSSTTSCSTDAARSSGSDVIVATIVIASNGCTMYGKSRPRRGTPSWAFTAKMIALSTRLVSICFVLCFSIFVSEVVFESVRTFCGPWTRSAGGRHATGRRIPSAPPRRGRSLQYI